MPDVLAPLVAMLSRNTVPTPGVPTCTAPPLLTACTPSPTEVMVLAVVVSLATVTVPAPSARASMPMPPDFTLPLAVTLTFPSSVPVV